MRMRQRPGALLLALVCMLLFAGCQPGSPTTQQPTPPSTAAATASPQPSPATVSRAGAPPDTLRWSLEGISDIASLDPAKPGDSATVTVLSLLFGGLVRLDENLEVQPDSAIDWQVSQDQTTYRFTIRDNLKFADGSPVTSEDFVFSINRALAPETASYGAPGQLNVIVGAADVISGTTEAASGITAPDARTLEIRLTEPRAYFLTQLVYPYTHVVQRALVESSADWTARAFGTGPYVVKEWKRGESILLTANEHYWQGKPGVPNILLPFSSDSEAAYRRYLAGELDIMGSLQNPLPAAHVPEVQSLPDFRTSPSLNTRYIGFNNTLPPFNNDTVRKAFALAVDKRTIADVLLAGTVVPADRILPTGLLGTQQPIRPLAFSPEAAQAALTEAGFPQGQGLPPIRLTYAPEGGENELVVQALKRNWEEHLGVAVELEPLALDDFNQALNRTRLTPDKGIQMYYSIWGADYPDPQNFLSQQLRTDSANNNGHFSDERFDSLVAEADLIGDRTQIQRRILLYNQAEQIAIDRVGWLPIMYLKFNVLLNPRVQGMAITPTGLTVVDWSKLTLAQ